MAPLVISVWQGKPSSSEGVEVALTALAQAASTAAANGAHMLILPELYLGGYRKLRATSETSALRVGASHGLTEVSETARRNKIAIVCGFYEKGERGGVYNSAIAVDADGTIRSVYRKTHLFGEAENAAFTPGDRLDDVFTLCGVRCGLLICYEYLPRLQPPDCRPSAARRPQTSRPAPFLLCHSRVRARVSVQRGVPRGGAHSRNVRRGAGAGADGKLLSLQARPARAP